MPILVSGRVSSILLPPVVDRLLLVIEINQNLPQWNRFYEEKQQQKQITTIQ